MQRAVTAIYRTYAVADLVRDEIANLGVSRGYISVVPDRDETLESGTYRETDTYNDDLHDLGLPEDEMRTYQEAVRRGDYVVSVNVDDDTHLDPIMEIMRRPEESYDIDSLDEEYRESEYVPRSGAMAGMGAAGAGAAMAGEDRAYDTAGTTTETGYTGDRMTGDRMTGDRTTGDRMTGDDEVIPVAEERLRVGKRDTGRGSMKVRTYTREVPVEERVTLRDETVHVDRRPATGGTLTGADAEAAFQDRSIEVEERHEEAVVTKDAAITEEIVVSKDSTTREEVVSDTVRKTEVDVDGDRGTTGTDRNRR